MTPHGFEAGPWVEGRLPQITEILEILGIDAGQSRRTMGWQLFASGSKSRITALPQEDQNQVLALLADIGLFNGRPAPKDEAPDHTLVIASDFRKLLQILPPLVGQDIVCLTSSRDWNEKEDGPLQRIKEIERYFAGSKWCQWATSAEATWERDTLVSSFSQPHGLLYGLAALAVLKVSNGGYDLAHVIPSNLNNHPDRYPHSIRLECPTGTATIYPRMGIGRGGERSDLRFWGSVVDREQTLFMGPGSVVRIAVHPVSVMRIGQYAQETLLQKWPDCHVDVVAAPVALAEQHAWLGDALEELGVLLRLSQ